MIAAVLYIVQLMIAAVVYIVPSLQLCGEVRTRALEVKTHLKPISPDTPFDQTNDEMSVDQAPESSVVHQPGNELSKHESEIASAEQTGNSESEAHGCLEEPNEVPHSPCSIHEESITDSTYFGNREVAGNGPEQAETPVIVVNNSSEDQPEEASKEEADKVVCQDKQDAESSDSIEIGERALKTEVPLVSVSRPNDDQSMTGVQAKTESEGSEISGQVEIGGNQTRNETQVEEKKEMGECDQETVIPEDITDTGKVEDSSNDQNLTSDYDENEIGIVDSFACGEAEITSRVDEDEIGHNDISS